jgi:hypothetical protein
MIVGTFHRLGEREIAGAARAINVLEQNGIARGGRVTIYPTIEVQAHSHVE